MPRLPCTPWHTLQVTLAFISLGHVATPAGPQAAYGWCVNAIKNARDPARLLGISLGVYKFDPWYKHTSQKAHALA